MDEHRRRDGDGGPIDPEREEKHRSEGGEDTPWRRREGRERPPILGEIARRLIHTSADVLSNSEEGLRTWIQDAKVPREAVASLVEQALRSKDEVQEMVAREMRRQLDRMDIKAELAKMLADYSLEVTARINFVPRDEDEEEPPEEEKKPRTRRFKDKKKKPQDVKVRLKRRSQEE